MKNAIEILGKNELPKLVREIPDPPKQLFMRGRLPNPNSKFLCVVGSRKNTKYGKEVCEKLIGGLRGYNIVIVSGLALGIDSIAHESALTAGLLTVALPGSGLSWNTLYPRANYHLAKRILLSGGALLSEFENNFRAVSYGFPIRNRLMAGMSHAVLVVEAELRSGTLITSRLATEYNRDVLTVPGSIFSKKSEGPHMLIRLGATPVRNSEDILAALGFALPETPDKHSQTLFPTRTYENCSSEEKKIVSLLTNPMNRNDLVAASGLNITSAIIAISTLELKGLIEETGGEVRLK